MNNEQMNKVKELRLMHTVVEAKAKKKSWRYRIKSMIYRPGMRYWKRHLLYFWGIHDEAQILVKRLLKVTLEAQTNDLRGLVIHHVQEFNTRAKAEKEAFNLPPVWLARDLDALKTAPDIETDHRRLLQELEYFMASSHGMAPMTVRRRLGELVGRYRAELDRQSGK